MLVAPLVGVFASCVLAQTPLAPSAGGQATQRAANQAVQSPAAAPSQSDAEATEAELVTDRPDFTESSEVVGHGVLQLETGFTFESDRLDHVLSRSITTPALPVAALASDGRRIAPAAVSNRCSGRGRPQRVWR